MGVFIIPIKTRCAALAAAAALLAAATAAQAADPGFCRNYANAALRQVRVARTNFLRGCR